MVGETPIIRINNLNSNKGVQIYAKLEGQNPGGSIKDRIAQYMIEQAEQSGELTKDKIILEPTSGNTGIGLAMIAIIKGYRIVLTMSQAMSKERKLTLRALGAEVIETDPKKGTDGAILRALELRMKNPEKYWMPNQFENPNNTSIHYLTTGKEIIEQVPEITHFIAGMGTTGTLMGVSQRLKEHNPNIQVIGVEPSPLNNIMGLKNMKEAIVPKIYNPKRLDKIVTVQTEESYMTARRLALKEGLLVGMSSGAAMYAGLKIASTLKSGNIVIIFPDKGDRYMSTALFNKTTN